MTLVIDPRFHGPPASANGGYAAGRLAGFVDADTVEVTLRAPPPLGRELRVERTGDGAATLHDGDVLVAEARPGRLDLDVPAPVPFEEAAAAGERFPFRDDHPFPTCFVCGPQREAGDGLRIFTGPARDVHAGAWTPDGSLAGPDGVVAPEYVWAALDCPSCTPVADPGVPILLGRITARLEGEVRAGEPHVVVAWPLEVDGRKRRAGAALFTAGGERRGVAEALWIEVRSS